MVPLAVEEWRREAEERRAAEEDRRWPAFWMVFCRTKSFSACGSRGADGGSFSGEVARPSLGPENDGFLRMPNTVSLGH
jgi:hypothetical protein